jgi:hypothetical protein
VPEKYPSIQATKPADQAILATLGNAYSNAELALVIAWLSAIGFYWRGHYGRP